MPNLRTSVILLAASLITHFANAATLYWTDVEGGAASEIRGTDAENPPGTILRSGLAHPRGIALDIGAGKMYWAEPGSLMIRRASLDSSGTVEDLTPADDGSAGIALDTAAGKMYWTSFDGTTGTARIRRANLDGSSPETLVSNNLVHPVGIALDVGRGYLYWTDLEGSSSGAIKRANLDGSNIQILLEGIDEANGLAVDPVGRRIYWTELTSKKIQRANLDGSGLQDIITNLDNPTTLALDLAERKIYWTDSRTGSGANPIRRANLDGSNVQTVISGLGFPWGIAVDPGPHVDLIRAVKPSFSFLRTGTTYQLQVSSDLVNWANHGGPFAATNTSLTYPEYFDVENWGKLFFRLKQQ